MSLHAILKPQLESFHVVISSKSEIRTHGGVQQDDKVINVYFAVGVGKRCVCL